VRAFPCRADQAVLAAISGAGQSCVQVGCRSGGCGVCRVEVLEGRYECGTMSHAQVDAADRARGVVLACQLFPRSDLRLRTLGRPRAPAAAFDEFLRCLRPQPVSG
jgi:ferredoxin